MRPAPLLLAGGVASLALAAALPAAAPERDGAAIYQDKCIYCHDARGWATRTLARRVPKGEEQLINRKALSADYTRLAVRRGIGSMPGFTPTDLSDKDLATVAAWLDKSR